MFKPKQLQVLAKSRLPWQRILQSRYVDHNVIRREIIQDIALRFSPKEEKACQAHSQAQKQRYCRGIVGDLGKAIQGRLLEGTIDQETVVVFRRLAVEAPKVR